MFVNMNWITEHSGLRKIPVQARAVERVERILDAAAEIFAEVGVEKATMESIAARAESSIGSVYQFFPDKSSLFRALAERSLARSREVFETLLAPGFGGAPWHELLDDIIDGYIAFEHADAGFRAIWANLHWHGVFAEADAKLYDLLIDRTRALVGQIAPGLRPKRQRLVAIQLVETVNAMIFVTARKDPSLAKGLVAETKTMLRRYLRPYIEDAEQGRG